MFEKKWFIIWRALSIMNAFGKLEEDFKKKSRIALRSYRLE